MKDSQLVQNAQDRYLYGTFIDASEAFNKGLMQASNGRPLQTNDPVGVVKNNYEEQLEGYLNKLPDDVDLAAVPDKYRNNIANFLSVQKSKYVNLANQVDEYEVGSEMYMDITNQMNNIRNSFENLDNQMKTYGKNKAEIIDNIQNQATSLYGENQANVNLLRSIYTEQFDMSIDEYGNISFLGDDGMVALNDLPGYELKDYKAAKNLMTLASNAYKNGTVLKRGGIMYNQYKNSIKMGIDQGGRNTLMSLIYDGLVGDTKMIDDPYIAQNVEAYKNGNITFEALRDVVVDNYMDVLVETSKQGYRVRRGSGSIKTPTEFSKGIVRGDFIISQSGDRIKRQNWKTGEISYIDKNTGAIINSSGNLLSMDEATKLPVPEGKEFEGIDEKRMNEVGSSMTLDEATKAQSGVKKVKKTMAQIRKENPNLSSTKAYEIYINQ